MVGGTVSGIVLVVVTGAEIDVLVSGKGSLVRTGRVVVAVEAAWSVSPDSAPEHATNTIAGSNSAVQNDAKRPRDNTMREV
jgi:hypothetical protein